MSKRREADAREIEYDGAHSSQRVVEEAASNLEGRETREIGEREHRLEQHALVIVDGQVKGHKVLTFAEIQNAEELAGRTRGDGSDTRRGQLTGLYRIVAICPPSCENETEQVS